MLTGRRLVLLAAPAAALQAGCSSPDPHYYSIAVRPGPTGGTGPKVVRLKDIGLASYLDRREIVRSSEGYRLDVMANDWWGESLGSMLGRVLALELGQRLPGSSIYGENGAIHADENASVGINIQRLDGDKAGSLVLLAQVAVEFNRPRRSAARSFDIRRPLPRPDIPGLVAAISDAVGELADGIAALLQT
ncbi:MAG: PqiC family protein [Reyranellaceae bacterium]